MGRRSKKDLPPSLIRGVVAGNVRELRDRVFAHLPNPTQRNKALAKQAGTTLSQIQRIIACEVGASIDMIEQLARVLQVRPHDLLTPYFAQQSSAGSTGPEAAPSREPHLENRRFRVF